MTYRTFRLPKKSRGYRTIHAPDTELKEYQKKQIPKLSRYFQKQLKVLGIENVPHGFIKGRNVITAAEQHVGYNFTVQMDISNFFDNTHILMLPKKFQDPKLFLQNGHGAQGFPTSPMVANICALPFIKGVSEGLPNNTVFTLYGDDLQISFNEEDLVESIKKLVTEQVVLAGFIINKRKTRLHKASNGFRKILGISVGSTSIRPTRKVLRKLRAAKHQGNQSSMWGLMEWAKCKKPKEVK